MFNIKDKDLSLGVIIALAVASSGCTASGGATRGVAVRSDGSPGPQECSDEAKKMMRLLRVHVGDSAVVYVDANQIGTRRLFLYDGPIESVMNEHLGLIETPARLYGQVWTNGPQVVIRYYEAHPIDGDKVPICAVARLGNDQMRKLPESKPGIAVMESDIAAAFVVDAFR